MNEETQDTSYVAPQVEDKDISSLEGIPEWKGPKEMFAKRKTARRANGYLYNYFSDTMTGACDEEEESSVLESSIIITEGAGPCSNGDAIYRYLVS